MSSNIRYPEFQDILDFSKDHGNQHGHFPSANNQQSHPIPLPMKIEAPVQGPEPTAHSSIERAQHVQSPQEKQAQLPRSGNNARSNLNDENTETMVIHEVDVNNGKIEVFVHQYQGQTFIGVCYKDAMGTVLRADRLIARLPVDDYVAQMMRPANQYGSVHNTNSYADGQSVMQNWAQPGSASQSMPEQSRR